MAGWIRRIAHVHAQITGRLGTHVTALSHAVAGTRPRAAAQGVSLPHPVRSLGGGDQGMMGLRCAAIPLAVPATCRAGGWRCKSFEDELHCPLPNFPLPGTTRGCSSTSSGAGGWSSASSPMRRAACRAWPFDLRGSGARDTCPASHIPMFPDARFPRVLCVSLMCQGRRHTVLQAACYCVSPGAESLGAPLACIFSDHTCSHPVP